MISSLPFDGIMHWVGLCVAGFTMCRQPQQKSGSKQPRSNKHQHHAVASVPPTRSSWDRTTQM